MRVFNFWKNSTYVAAGAMDNALYIWVFNSSSPHLSILTHLTLPGFYIDKVNESLAIVSVPVGEFSSF